MTSRATNTRERESRPSSLSLHPRHELPPTALIPGSMEKEEEEEKKKKKKKHKHAHRARSAAAATPTGQPLQPGEPATDPHFKPSADVKGLRFGGQLVVKSFTVRRAGALELLRLLAVPPSPPPSDRREQQEGEGHRHNELPFPSTTSYLPTNFTILAHHAWHTLTLGMGTRKSKAILFVFESEGMKSAVDRVWPPVIPLGEVNRRLLRGLPGCEMARFKFRKGCLTFYVYAVRRAGASGFWRAEELRWVLESVVALKDFLDHTAMLALPSQRSITFPPPPVAVAH